MDRSEFLSQGADLLACVYDFVEDLGLISWSQLLSEAGGAERVAVVAVDVVNGFCKEGALASDRVARIVPEVRRLLIEADEAGVSNFYFPCDSHPPDSPEFQSFPPHCLSGSAESQLVQELAELDFVEPTQVIEKGSISSLVDTDLAQRLLVQKPTVIICAGDCSDLCLYQLALGLRYLANSRKLSWRILVDTAAVDTYDLDTATAAEAGIPAHPGEFFHRVFLYHLRLQGIEVFKRIGDSR